MRPTPLLKQQRQQLQHQDRSMHKEANAAQRSCVLMHFAIFLARGRGQIYSRNLGVIEMVAAAEAAAVMM